MLKLEKIVEVRTYQQPDRDNATDCQQLVEKMALICGIMRSKLPLIEYDTEVKRVRSREILSFAITVGFMGYPATS